MTGWLGGRKRGRLIKIGKQWKLSSKDAPGQANTTVREQMCAASKKIQKKKVEKDELEAMFEHDLRKFLLQ